MDLSQHYRRVLDGAFARNVPGWDELSPMDPMKVLAESVALGIAEAERRQRRVVETALDCMPALFGFNPKPAVPPTGLFAMTPVGKAASPARLPEGAKIPFRDGNVTFLVQPVGEATIEPVHRFQFSSLGSTFHARFFHPGGTGITLYYAGDRGGDPVPASVKIRARNRAGDERVVTDSSLRIEDGTAGFTRPGWIRLAMAQPETVLFPAGGSEVEIEWKARAGALRGELLPNVFTCRVLGEATDRDLGALEGEPWEVIPLPETVLAPPDSLSLIFPDDTHLRLERVAGELLRLRHADPERMGRGYFYEGSLHALVFPLAHELVGPYPSGARVIAHRVTAAPTSPMPSPSAQPALGELGSILESVRPLAGLTALEPRETTGRFLDRFFGTMRVMTSPVPTLVAADVKAAVLGCHEAVRAVELDFDEKRRVLTAFVLASAPLAGAEASLPPAVHERTLSALEDRVPLDVTCRVLPFRETTISLDLTLSLALSEQRLGLIDPDRIAAETNRLLRERCLPPPYGGLEAGDRLSLDSLWESVRAGLASGQGDNSPLRRTEVVGAHGLAVHGPTARYLDEITRAPGEILRIEANLELDVQAAETRLERPSPVRRLAIAREESAHA